MIFVRINSWIYFKFLTSRINNFADSSHIAGIAITHKMSFSLIPDIVFETTLFSFKSVDSVFMNLKIFHKKMYGPFETIRNASFFIEKIDAAITMTVSNESSIFLCERKTKNFGSNFTIKVVNPVALSYTLMQKKQCSHSQLSIFLVYFLIQIN